MVSSNAAACAAPASSMEARNRSKRDGVTGAGFCYGRPRPCAGVLHLPTGRLPRVGRTTARKHAMPSTESSKPASAPDLMPPHELPEPGTEDIPEGTNATIHSPDPKAEQHPAR